jgi:hypothetical protein
MTQTSGSKSDQGKKTCAEWARTTRAEAMLSVTAAGSSGSPSQIRRRIRALVLFNIHARAPCLLAGPRHRDPAHGGMRCEQSTSLAPERLLCSLASRPLS